VHKNAYPLLGLLIFATVSISYLALNSQKDAGLGAVEQIEVSELDMKLLGRSASAAKDKSLKMLEARTALHSEKKRSDRETPEWTPLLVEEGVGKFSLDQEKAIENNGNKQILANDSPEVAADLKSLAMLDSEGLDPRLMRDSAGNITAVSGSFDLILATGEIAETIASVEKLIEQHSSVFSIGDDERAVADMDVDTLSSGENILRVNRNYKGLPVWGKQLVVTVDNGRAKSVAGNFKGVEEDLDLSAKLSESEIEELALSELRTSGYKTASVLDSQEGIYFFTPIAQHAHKVTVQAKTKRWDLFFSPSTKTLIAKIPKFYEVSTVSSGTDLTGAVQSFRSWSDDGKYILWDNSFPIDGHTEVIDWNGSEPHKWSESLFSDSGWDPAAVSAHVNASLSYKYFLDSHQRNSFDGKGTKLMAYVNVLEENGDPYGNAGWWSGGMYYGAGSDVNYAIALDVAAHEFTHGVVESTSNLIYHNESGALNESFADFFGVMVDRDDWLLGESLSGGTDFDRSLKTPESRGQPSRWEDYRHMPDDDDNDHGGVHYNSGIQNRALYLIAEGLSEEGLGTSIGKEKTEQIAYKTLERLTSDARFIDSANTMILQARSLFGEESVEAVAVTLAWATVGVVESAVVSSVGGTDLLTLAEGDDVIAHLYPKDGTMDNLWSEEYDLYVQTINQPFSGHISSLEYGPLNDVAAKGSKPSLMTSESGTLWIRYIGNDDKVRSTMLSDYGDDLVLEIDNVQTVTESPNGQQIALVQTSSNKIWIYNFPTSSSELITVRGPNYSEGAQVDVVTRVDAVNFDSTGQKIIFDFEICRPMPNSDCETVWSIGIYDQGTKTFSYPFSSADTKIDIGFPRFANSTNNVIAFDVVDWNDFDANGKAASQSRVFDLLVQKTLGAATTNIGTSRTSSWGIPSFVANDKALAIQAQTDTTTHLYQMSLDENYNFIPGTWIWLTPFQSGFAQAHRNGYLSITSKLNPNSRSLDLGTLKLGSGASGEFTITNEGNRELVITSIISSGSALSSNLTNRALSAGETLAFDASLDSTLEKEGSFTGTLTINHNGDNASAVFGVSAYLDIDTDEDGILNTADTDDDGDNVLDANDAFPLDSTETVDTDADGVGNNADTDDDGDNALDVDDAYPLISVGELTDTDKDGRPNDCDEACVTKGMAADTDDDGDSVVDTNDAFPLDATESVDTDSDGVGNNADTDDDGDSMDDVFEIANSLNPLVNDADGDSDGDGLSNFQEFTDGTPLDQDSLAPVLTMPDNVTLDSTGPLTVVPLGTSSAEDFLDGSVSVSLSRVNPFAPGLHEVTYTASDAAGNKTSAVQILKVNPIVVVPKLGQAVEGKDYTVEVFLNGQAPAYPVVIPITFSGTATQNEDYTASADSIQIDAGTSGSLVLSIADDGQTEEDESILINLGVPESNAVLGSVIQQEVSIVSTAVPPRLSLAVQQNGLSGSFIAADSGNVLVTLSVADVNGTHTVDWTSSDNNIVALDSLTTLQLEFDPVSMAAGLYEVLAQVTDSEIADGTFPASIVVKVSATSAPLDTDGDGIPDEQDTFEASNAIALENGTGAVYTDSGLTLVLGDSALNKGNAGIAVTEADVASSGEGTGPSSFGSDSSYNYPGGLYDFKVTGLPVAGGSVNVVIPLSPAAPANAQYRKYTDLFGWTSFVRDSSNAVKTAAGASGACPQAGSASYQSGLTQGHTCLQLTIEDGGPNDSDGSANGVVDDPGGIATAIPQTTTPSTGGSAAPAQSSGGGGGCSVGTGTRDPMLPLIVLLCLVGLTRHKWRVLLRK